MAIPDPQYQIDQYALTTLARVKHHFDIDEADTSFDAIYTRLINAMTGKIENFIRRKVRQRQHIDYRSGRQNSHFLLRQWPAEKPSEIAIDASSVFTSPDDIVDPSEYALEMSSDGSGIGVMLLGGNVFPRGTRNVRITYTAGYAQVPAAIEEACIFGVEWLLDLKEDRRVGVKSKNKNNETVTFNEDLPTFLKTMLLDYQRVEVPDLSSPIDNL